MLEVAASLGMNLLKACKENELNYVTSISQMQRVYKHYHIIMEVAAVGARRTPLENATNNLRQLRINEKANKAIHRVKKAATLGTIYVWKTAIKIQFEKEL